MGGFYRHRPTNRRLQAADVELAWVMYEEGRLTIAEIAGEIGVCAGTLSIYLREYRAAVGGMDFLRSLDRVRPRTAGRPPVFDDRTSGLRERVRGLADDGMRRAEIAETLGVHVSTVGYYLRRSPAS